MSADVASTQTLRPGDVVTYEPENRWCHDGWAIAESRDDGRIVLVDTYWVSGGHLVNPESYEVLFNLADYDCVERREQWEKYAEVDRRRIPRHSGYQTLYLVQKGATPDLATQIENARERVAEAEHEVRAAQHTLDWRRRDLAELEAQVSV